MYREAARILRSSEVELLTSDVFDTLVWRPVAEPDHLFVRLGDALIADGSLPAHVDANVFAMGRSIAERRARHAAGRLHDSAECTLEEIWSEMPLAWRSSAAASWGDYIETELCCEAAHLRAIPRAVDLLRIAADHGCPSVLISDTYLSGAQLRRVLGDAGIPLALIDDVVTSSDRRCNKSDGLLARVAAERGVATGAVLHIGDNPDADVAAAERAGAQALLTDVADSQRITDAMPSALRAFSERHGTDGGARALTRMLLLDQAERGADVDAAYQFGASVGGPMLAGFGDWLTTTTAELGTSRVHYLLREGAFLADVVGALRADAPTPVLVHASRWVNMRASVFEGSPDELFRSLARRVAFRPEHVTEAFGVDAGLVRSTLGDRVRDDEGRIEAIETLAASEEIRGAIIESSAALRRRVMRYLEARLQPEDGRLTLCDIGWGGTIQESLTDLLIHEGWDVEVVGLYLLLSTPGLERRARGARMLGFLPADGPATAAASIVMRTPEIPEQLCTPDLGTLPDIAEDGSPVVAPVSSAAVGSRARARRGVLDFVTLRRTLYAQASDDPLVSSRPYAAALLDGLAGTIAAPDRSLAAEIGTWEHDDVRGEGYEPLVNPAAADTVRFLNAADLDQVGMRELYWVPGAAAIDNPALAAQLEAVRLGVDADLLCPESETGPGLIALFAPDSLEAFAQTSISPHRNADGWMMLRLSASIERLRDIRVDLGNEAALVELDRISVRRTPPGSIGAEEVIRITDADDTRVRWANGFPLGPRHAVLAADGHLVVAWPADGSTEIGNLAVDVVYRAWRLGDDDSAHFAPTARHRWRTAGSLPRRLLRRVRVAATSFSPATAGPDAGVGDARASAAPPDS